MSTNKNRKENFTALLYIKKQLSLLLDETAKIKEIVNSINYFFRLERKKEIEKFLKLVAIGNQFKAEKMLKKNKYLAISTGNLKDHAERKFKKITGFQYAVWALDWQMWEMIKKFLSDEQILNQIKEIDTSLWVKVYGQHINWKNLLLSYKKLLDNWNNWNLNEINQFWIKEIGKEQLNLPMHALQEYCQPNRPFTPCPNFEGIYSLERNIPDWLLTGIRKKLIGKNWFILRDYLKTAIYQSFWKNGYIELGIKRFSVYVIRHDFLAVAKLLHTRIKQRRNLIEDISRS